MLGDGFTVLFAGGDGGGTAGSLTSYEYWNFFTNSSNERNPGNLTDAREFHTANLLSDGLTVLVTGGLEFTGTSLADFVNPGQGNPAFAIMMVRASIILQSAETINPRVVSQCVGGVSTPCIGTMSSPRVGHTAITVNNGNDVIVEGGLGFPENNTGISSPTATVDDFSFNSGNLSGNFNQLANMKTARAFQTAARFSSNDPNFSGGFLVVGGRDSLGNLLNTAEIYCCGSGGNFTPVTNPISSPRLNAQGTLLDDGTILITGGEQPASMPSFMPNTTIPALPVTSTAITNADIFVSAPGNFFATDSMSTSRQFHTATLLANGSVFIAGGENALGVLDTTEIYDGSEFTTFAPIASSGSPAPRVFHTANEVPSGLSPVTGKEGVLITGGIDNSGAVHNEILLGIPSATSGQWQNEGTLSKPRLGHTATFDGVKYLIAGGQTSDGTVLNTADLWTPGTGLAAPSGHTMVSTRVYQTATAITNPSCETGQILLAGGGDTNGNILNTAELYNPDSDTFTATGGTMTSPREFHSAVSLGNGQVLIVGGDDNDGALATAEVYNPCTGTFGAVGRMPSARSMAGLVLLSDGDALVAGGEGNADIVLSDAELYDPQTQQFTPTDQSIRGIGGLQNARFGFTATTLENGLVLLTGGDDAFFDTLASAEIYDPRSGPVAAGAQAVLASSSQGSGKRGKTITAGVIQATNQTGATEQLSSVTVTFSDPAVFSSIELAGTLNGGKHATTSKAKPAASVEFAINPPLSIPAGGTATLTVTGKLAKGKHSAGSSSAQLATAVAVSSGNAAIVTQGLPIALGSVTVR